MDQGTAGVTPHKPEELEREIETLRSDLTGVLGELDLRRHELLDWRLQLRRHRGALAIGLGAIALVVAGSVALGIARRRQRERLMARAGRLRLALARAVAHPDLVARPEPTVGKKVLAAGLSAAAGVVARSLASRAMQRTVDER